VGIEERGREICGNPSLLDEAKVIVRLFSSPLVIFSRKGTHGTKYRENLGLKLTSVGSKTDGLLLLSVRWFLREAWRTLYRDRFETDFGR
jgi:hypothetical protein